MDVLQNGPEVFCLLISLLLLVTDPGKEKETIIRLARVGFEKIDGHLAGGFEAWKKAGEKADMIVEVEADELLMDQQFDESLIVLDVRKENEFAEGHLQGAMNLPLNEMIDPGTMANIEDGHNLICALCRWLSQCYCLFIIKTPGHT